jgi:Right handed beta helix region
MRDGRIAGRLARLSIAPAASFFEGANMSRNRWIGGVVASLLGSWCGVASADQLVVPNEFATIGAAVAAADPGDEIKVKSGTYNEILTITTDGLRLVAEGKVKLNGGGAGVGITIAGVNECHVIDFELRDYATGILVTLCADVEIAGCRFVDIDGSAIELNAIGGQVADCEFQRVQFGVRALAAAAIDIRRNEFSECVNTAIVVEGSGVVVAKNVIERCGVIGIQIGLPTKGVSQANHVVVEKNKISRIESLFFLKGSVERAGIDVDYNAVNVTLTGNTVKDVDGKGIRIGADCSAPMVVSNKVSATSSAGIEVAAQATTVTGNKVRESATSGIHVIGIDATDCYVLGNDVKGCDAFGIRLGSTFGIAVFNKVRNCTAGSITADDIGQNFIGENDTDD